VVESKIIGVCPLRGKRSLKMGKFNCGKFMLIQKSHLILSIKAKDNNRLTRCFPQKARDFANSAQQADGMSVSAFCIALRSLVQK